MSKGINPAGAEHNKCDILKLLRSAIRLCKLIGDIQQKEMSKKKGGGDAALGTGNSGASVSDKTSPDFLPHAGVLRLWLYALNKMAKSCPTCTTVPSEIILHLTQESLRARSPVVSQKGDWERTQEQSGLIWEQLQLKGGREPLFWVSANEASHLSLTRTLWFPHFHYISNEAPQRLFKNVSLTFLKREVDPWLSLRWGLKARLKATVSLLCPLLRPERGTVPPKPNPAA